jgi:hypothetical protein
MRQPTTDIPRPTPRGRARRAAGFTLIEAALTMVIIGTGVLAMVAAQQAYHRKNDWAGRTSMGMMLANELREMTLTLPEHDPFTGTDTMGPEANELTVQDYDDLDDFAGTVDATGYGSGLTFNPPINALRQTITDLPRWSQKIKVENVLPDNISSTFTQPLGTTHLMRVTVTVTYLATGDEEPTTISTLSWVVGE